MFTEANIQFEDGILIAVSESRKENIRKKLYVLVSEMAEKLALNSLENVIIKSKILFDSKAGTAYEDNTIELSFSVASTLTNDPDHTHPDQYKDALATLYHEGYHISDYQKVMQKLSNPSSAVLIGYKIWTEFLAVYKTYHICEQDHQYRSFEIVFSKHPKDKTDCRYFTSHLMGYFLHKDHSHECDQLIHHFLNTNYIEATTHHLQEMLDRYPNISTDEFLTLKRLFEKLLCDKIDTSNFKELRQEDYIRMLRDKAKIK